jgi:hypothetical protein
MGKLKFNPDDFVFERLPSPDEKKTILEYDAKNRLILLRTKDDDGQYVYNTVVISDAINQNILANIPNEWSNDNDRIILFAIYESGEYILEKEKMKYDFPTKSTKWIQYTSDFLTVEQAKELYNVLNTAIVVDTEVKNYSNLKDYLELSKKSYYLTQFNKENIDFIEKLLRDTDWRILPDAPEVFENERKMWVLWRSKIRELNKLPSDFEDSLDYLIWLEEMKWPIRPDQYYGKYPEFEVKYLETDDQFVSNPDFLDPKKSQELMNQYIKFGDLVHEYEEQGFKLSPTMSNLVTKYNLIKDMEEFKKVKIQEAE